MDRDARLRRLQFRAWHRGTKEADYMLGGFYDTYAVEFDDAEIDWYEAILEEQDVDIMAWAIGTQSVPERWIGPMMERLRRLDYISIPQ